MATTYLVKPDSGHNPWRIVRKVTGRGVRAETHKLAIRFPTQRAARLYLKRHRAVLDQCA